MSQPQIRHDPNDIIELEDPPEFEVGFKVKAVSAVRNDGTYPGRPMGDILIAVGDVGYVNRIGSFLQRYWIYGVDFYERGMIVGMRAHELELVDDTCSAPHPRFGDAS
ncbi:MAG TPA: nitrogen fixation protein NifZ [Azospirillaceae bacterium]|nr:nitrogen fixation protein NifZ [Azospirillaceae bacterium]